MEQNELNNSEKWWVYGVLYPIGLLCACAIAEWLTRL